MTQKHVRIIGYNWALLVIIAILASGCALTKECVNLGYIPEAGVSKVDGADLVEVSVNLTDVRTTKDKVSCKKNGYGMEMAAIISNNDVVTLVANAIEDELRNRGFEVTEGSVHVGIELNKFYNDFKIGFWSGSAASEVVMNVQVKKSDGNINYAKSITGLYTKKGIQLCSGKNAKMALEEALKDAISKLMNDSSFIAALLKAET